MTKEFFAPKNQIFHPRQEKKWSCVKERDPKRSMIWFCPRRSFPSRTEADWRRGMVPTTSHPRQADCSHEWSRPPNLRGKCSWRTNQQTDMVTLQAFFKPKCPESCLHVQTERLGSKVWEEPTGGAWLTPLRCEGNLRTTRWPTRDWMVVNLCMRGLQ